MSVETQEQKRHRLAVYQAEMAKRGSGGVHEMLARWALKLDRELGEVEVVASAPGESQLSLELRAS